MVALENEVAQQPVSPYVVPPPATNGGYVQTTYPATNGVSGNGVPVEAIPPSSAYVPDVTMPPAHMPAAMTPEEYNSYIMSPAAPWPPPIFVRRSAAPEERFYLDNRWYSQWKFFDKKASDNKWWYQFLQLIIGVGSVVVPVLVGLSPTNQSLTDVVRFSTVVISLLVAICAAIENIYKYGENWRSYRQAAEELQQEKSLYDVKAGRYAGNPEPFTRFAERCEEIIAKQNGQFMQTVEKQQTQSGEQNAQLEDRYRAEAQKQMTTFTPGGIYAPVNGSVYGVADANMPAADAGAVSAG